MSYLEFMRQRGKTGQFTHLLKWFSLMGGAFFAYGLVSFFRSEFPNVGLLKSHYPIVQYRGPDEAPDVTLAKSRPLHWVSLSQVSQGAIGAIVVSEDWAFYQHKGFDSNQITEAVKKDLKTGKFARGASTITQQVVRNVFLEKDKKIWRKVKELYLAIELEKVLGKGKILEVYLNIAEWGQGIFGIRFAAQYYFNKTPDQLTAKEGAFLAMLLPSPKRYSASFKAKELTKYAQTTVDSILAKMVQAQYLTEEGLHQQLATPLSFEKLSAPVSVPASENSAEPVQPVEPETISQPETVIEPPPPEEPIDSGSSD